jgi:hypothetical protein
MPAVGRAVLKKREKSNSSKAFREITKAMFKKAGEKGISKKEVETLVHALRAAKKARKNPAMAKLLRESVPYSPNTIKPGVRKPARKNKARGLRKGFIQVILVILWWFGWLMF